MSSIWTPYGEHEPPEAGAGSGAVAPDRGPAPGEGPPAGPSSGGAGPDPGFTDEQIQEMLRRLIEMPVADIVADHAARLHEVAVLHLGAARERPGSLGAAALAIDAMAALVDGLGDRLGAAAAPLGEALAQLRLAYVEVSSPGGADQPAS
ncbi:MAG: hypothetical protein KJ056_00640 [Acidimicrobiia bacterium]|nr:hypothetical protein [Acidimicrobiia bacterium]MCL4291526.1 hypothetical protein [Acidimicrobiia bacterium]